MATSSSILAWKIPWTEEPGGLQSMGLLRVVKRLFSSSSLSAIRVVLSAYLFLPGVSQGRGSLECNPDGIFQARVLEWVAISFSRGSS